MSSVRSGDPSPLRMRVDSGRVAGFRRSHEDEEYYKGLGSEEEEEEEDDDDHVRRSWTTEKEAADGRFESAALTSFRFRGRGEDERGEESEEAERAFGEEEEEEREDSDASFGSLEWVTRQLRQLEKRDDKAEDEDAEEEEEEEEDDRHTAVEDSVQQALSLLNGESDGHSEAEDESWARDHGATAERRASSYFDIVQEAMGAEWRQDDEYEHREAADDGENQRTPEEEEEEEDEEEDAGVADEWLEAFTAKGRVYYYNRRTRESSWTKPASLVLHETVASQRAAAENQDEAEARADEEDDREEEEEEEEVETPARDERVEATQRSAAGSVRSSTSSTSSSDRRHEAHSRQHEPSTQTTLFCCFCGSPMRGAGGLQRHLSECETLRFHKQSASPLFEQFQRMLVLLSEDASLRSLHYAASFPDATPDSRGEETAQQSVRESLALLRAKHRSSRRSSVHRTLEDDRVASLQPVARSSSQPTAKKPSPPPREPLASRYANLKQKPTAVALLNMETCRHCGRSFAEGRLAKHEAVCPRVFGNETSWGRGSSSALVKASPQDADQGPSTQRQDPLSTLKKRRGLKHTLALSFQEHQASLVECPCCRRKFAPSGAQQHIDICKTVQHRPRNPVPLLKDYALAG